MELPRGYLRAISRFEIYGIPDKLIANISNKTDLAFLAAENPRSLGNYMPQTYYWNRNLQHDVDYFAQQESFFQTLRDEAAADSNEVTWVLKREATSRGRGITLISANCDVRALRNYRLLDRPHVAQRYISDPCLIPSIQYPGKGYKFDLRIYVAAVVNGKTGEMNYYQYHEGFARRCTQLYSVDKDDGKSSHLTNSAINAKAGDKDLQAYIRHIRSLRAKVSVEERFLLPVVDDEDSDTEDSDSENEQSPEFPKTMRLSKVLQLLKASSHLGKSGVKTIEDDIRRLLIELFSCTSQLAKNYLQDSDGGLEYEKHLAILGIDVMLNKHFKPSLIEVNRYPDFGIYSMEQYHIKKTLVEDILSLAFPACCTEDLVSIRDSAEADVMYDKLNPVNLNLGDGLPTEVEELCPEAWCRLDIC